jgi:multiple antibiotic resistance protein
LVITLFFGEWILHLFHIQFNAFIMAGSLVIATLGWSMVNIQRSGQKHSEEENDEASTRDAVTVVPLAIPILAGPGAISAVISYSVHADFTGQLICVGVIFVVALVIAVVLSLATKIRELLGVSGLNILTRLFGLLLLSIAIGGMANALKALFPSLAGH